MKTRKTLSERLDEMVTQAAATGNLANGDWAWAVAEYKRLKNEGN